MCTYYNIYSDKSRVSLKKRKGYTNWTGIKVENWIFKQSQLRARIRASKNEEGSG